VSVYSFAAIAPVLRRYARALRPRIAPPWSASALASQRARPRLLDTSLASSAERPSDDSLLNDHGRPRPEGARLPEKTEQ
jgi:hypothetical protein